MLINLFLAVHGNTQNSEIARRDWMPIMEDDKLWQMETIQSAEPDGYGTYRWSYDMFSYIPVANAIGKKLQKYSYRKKLYVEVFRQDVICCCVPFAFHQPFAIC